MKNIIRSISNVNGIQVITLIVFVTTLILTPSCTTTLPATSKTNLDATIEEVKSDLKQMGYYASGFSSEQKHLQPELASDPIQNVDTYKFENSNGDKMQFKVQYRVSSNKTSVAEVETSGYEATNIKDYDNLQTPIKKVDNMPLDENMKVPAPKKTMILSLVGSFGLLGAVLIIAAPYF